MKTSQTPLVVLAFLGIVSLNVTNVMSGELVDSLLDFYNTVGFPHSLGGEVGVHTGTVPVSGDRLGVQRDHYVKIFGDSVQEIPGHPEIISHVDSFARSYLELPLGGHNFGILTGDVDSRVEAGAVVGFDDITTEHTIGADSAIVRTLGAGETILGPSEGVIVGIEKSPLLFHAEPGMLISGSVHGIETLVTVVSFGGLLVVLVGFAHDKFVVAETEGIFVEGNWVEVHVTVAALGLPGGGTIEIPDGELC